MKFEIEEIRTYEVKYIQVDVAVRYGDEDMPFDAPLRTGEFWRALIDLDEKKVADWPQGKTLSFHMKICDEGIYTLLDADKKEIKKIGGYVPNRLLPGSYGDYLELNIDEHGVITNWLKNANLSNFSDEV